MACCKSLLILSYFCLCFPSFLLSKVLNDTNNNVHGSYTNILKSTESNFTVQPRKEISIGSYEECDCGTNSIFCRLDIYGKKKCTCRYGYVALISHRTFEEECRKCDCGENSISCKAVDGKKKCTCQYGYAPKISIPSFEEYCRDCDCGRNSKSCEFDSIGRKKCTCLKGYGPYSELMRINEVCEICNCGINEISCELDYMKRRKCTCEGDSVAVYGEGGEKCSEKCNCGPHSLSCRMTYGSKTCSCKAGYVARLIPWGTDEECVLEDIIPDDKPSSSISFWKILTYVVAVSYAFIIITMLIVIFNKHTNMHRR